METLSAARDAALRSALIAQGRVCEFAQNVTRI